MVRFLNNTSLQDVYASRSKSYSMQDKQIFKEILQRYCERSSGLVTISIRRLSLESQLTLIRPNISKSSKTLFRSDSVTAMLSLFKMFARS